MILLLLILGIVVGTLDMSSFNLTKTLDGILYVDGDEMLDPNDIEKDEELEEDSDTDTGEEVTITRRPSRSPSADNTDELAEELEFPTSRKATSEDALEALHRMFK